MPKFTPGLAMAAAIAFVGIVGAYVALVITGHGSETGGLVTAVLTLLGFLGLGAHQSQRLGQQDAALDVITHQTNGVLTQRIQDGADAAMRQVLREAGYNVPAATVPTAEPVAEVPPL